MSITPKAKIFHFLGYHIDLKKKRVIFDYRVEFANTPPLDFTETIIMPKASQKLGHRSVHKFLEPLQLILGISYYKLYCPPKIKLPFALSREQAEFWNIVYRKGLGEFLYRNQLSPEHLAKFPFAKVETGSVRVETAERALLGIGGGKDSIVAAELLKNFDFSPFLIETQRWDFISEEVVKKIGRESVKVERLLDEKIFLEHVGAYNGHIPISAIFAFLGLLTAYLYEYKYVIVGNEYSSNFGNLSYRGETINHQWSKSMEFEAMLQAYTDRFISPDVRYFSLLRQFYEIRIAEMFAKHQKYFRTFSSCNRSFRVYKKRTDALWCGECPKCAFVYLMLAPFLDKQELFGIFKKHLLEDASLLPMYRDLLGYGRLKPFDCVGTFEESRAAMFLIAPKYGKDLVVKALLPLIKQPEKNVELVMRTMPAPTLPTPFRFLGIKNACLLGYGKEGHVTEKYIRKKFPKMALGVLDEQQDRHYLSKQVAYDLGIRTPGLSKTKIKIPYVTATNIFFAQNKNFVIGVTGTKGKSTTASLICHILKTAGKKVRLVGNIGNPMLGTLLSKRDPQEIFVIELSSYMLDDIEYSPNIAVLLNLFPEHMDYHGSIANYYEAKENIFRFQKAGDLAIRFPFKRTIKFNPREVALLGQHNLSNIDAAIEAVKPFKIPRAIIKKAVSSFKPLPHRLEFVGEFEGVKFYDDAISTTPESTIMAIKSLDKVGTIFLGGTDRGYNFDELEKVLRLCKIRNVVLFPESGKRIMKNRQGLNVLETRSMEEAVAFAKQHTAKGEICLLSTASPSYSLWKNFEDKGETFKYFVRKSK